MFLKYYSIPKLRIICERNYMTIIFYVRTAMSTNLQGNTTKMICR